MSATINSVDINKFHIIKPHFNFPYLTYRELEVLSDNFGLEIADDTETAADIYEIVVGSADREGVRAVKDKDRFEIRITDKKVFLNGGSPPALTMAVSEFIKLLEKEALTDLDSAAGNYNEVIKKYNPKTYYIPKFYDDFDGDTLDETKWVQRGGTGNSGWSCESLNGGRCDRSLDPEKVYVKNSMFQVHPWYDAENNVYYGGFIETNGKMLFTYGYAEISCKIADGSGFWTSLWLRCRDYSGPARPEIDVNECFGNGTYIAANLHTWPGEEAEVNGVAHTQLSLNDYGERKHACPDGKKYSEDFHTFGVLWTDEIAWFTCDGVPYFKYNMGDKPTDKACFGKKMWVVISEAIGFKHGYPIGKATEEQWKNSSQFYVDWFYLYQIDDGKQSIEFGKEQMQND